MKKFDPRPDYPAPLDPSEPDLSREIERALAESLAPLPPDAARADKLRNRLLERARVSRLDASAFHNVRREDGVWRDVAGGVRVKLLQEGHGSRSVLVEFQPGASLPTHRHNEHEECVVLRGEATLGDLTVRQGDYHIALAGSRHGRVSSATGALLYLRGVPLGSTLESARDMLKAWLPGRGAAPTTVRASEGEWDEIAPGVHSKPLWHDGASRSILLRMAPGAVAAAHPHAVHEECLLLEGEAFLGDTLLREGEYQFAPAGTAHRDVFTDTGALLFVHGAAVEAGVALR